MTRGLVVVKVGGGLSGIDGALDRVLQALAAAARHRSLLLVPGGGPFADAVRSFDTRHSLGSAASHWMAILAMDQYAHVLADKLPDADVVDDPGEMGRTLAVGRIPVLAPSRWMRAADTLPRRWDVTGDSVAAFVAGAVGAERLVLIKPVTGAAELLDPFFASALPVGLPFSVVGCDQLADLPRLLAGPS